MQNQSIKNFWIKVIDDLKTYKGVDPVAIAENDLDTTDATWRGKLNNEQTRDDIRDYAMIICENIFDEATQNQDVWVDLIAGSDDLVNYIVDEGIDADVWNGWNTACFNTVGDQEAEIIEAQNCLGVDDLGDLTTEAKLQIPAGFNLEDVVKWFVEFDKAFDKELDIFEVNASNQATGISETKIDAYLEAKNEYTRIHTKLSGKVSDAELDNLLNTPPQCSHSDYDTIKSERDTLKTELSEKESQLLQKLITDCNLGIDKNSTLDQVITKIKGLSPTAPVENAAKITELEQQKSQLETQLKDKEKTISELQSQKPTEEVKNKVIESSKQLGLFSSEFQQKLANVSTYQELAQVQQEVFKEKLLEKEESLQRIESNTKQLKVGLVVLVVFLVLVVASAAGYLVRGRKKLEKKE